jgi:glycosyltransferase 2 family protein
METALSNWKRNIVGLTISSACIAYIGWRINFTEIMSVILDFQVIYLLIGVLSLVFGYTMRIVRWCVLLRASGAEVSALKCVAPFLGSIALNNILPLRAGDVVRALIFPSAIGVSKLSATSSLVMERLVDLSTLLICLVIGLAIASEAKLPYRMEAAAIFLAIMAVFILMFVFYFSRRLSLWCSGIAAEFIASNNSWRKRLFLISSNLLASFDVMSRLPVLVALFGLSTLVWAGEVGLFWSLLLGFRLIAGPETALIVMAIATLSTLIPSSPGYVGPFHLAAYAAISMLDGSPAQAANFAIVSHLSVWLPATVAGGLAILFNPQLFTTIKDKHFQ